MWLDHLLSKEPLFVVCLLWVCIDFGVVYFSHRCGGALIAHTVRFTSNTLLFWGWMPLALGCCCGGSGFWVWVVGELYSGCLHLYSCVILFCLVLLGVRWMPWHQELMKDVVACDMPRGVGERVLIRGFPNGET